MDKTKFISSDFLSLNNFNFIIFLDNFQKPQLLGPNQENKTVTLGGSVTFHCAIQSSGPTEIQWLKQLHDHQQPKNPNKTVIVFDYIFEVRFGLIKYFTVTLNCSVRISS